jgi:hypothetical protein
MHQNLFRLWLVLLVTSGAIALWYSGVALVGVCKFSLLNTQTSAEVMRWQVREISSSRFAVEADYQFTVKDVTYHGKTKFENPQFLNRFAAENYIANIGAKPWKMWYRESNPTRSSLEREFPQKNCLQALLTVGVFAYFFFARSMLSRVFA